MKEIEAIDTSVAPSGDALVPFAEPSSGGMPIGGVTDTGSVSRPASVSVAGSVRGKRAQPSGLAVLAIGATMLVTAVTVVAFSSRKDDGALTARTWRGSAMLPRIQARPAQSPPDTSAPIASAATPDGTAATSASAAPKPAPALLTGPLPHAKPDCRQPKVFVNGIWKYRPECMDQ